VPKEYFLPLLSKQLRDLTGKSVMPRSLSAQDTLAAYLQENAGYGEKLVFRLEHRTGFGSNINRMIAVQLHCLVCKTQFQLDLSRWFPDDRDADGFKVFAPFGVSSNLSEPTVCTAANPGNIGSLIVNWLPAQHFYYPQLGIDGGIFHAKSVIAKMILQPIADITGERWAATEDLKPYVAVHVRRGDKVNSGEAEKIEVSKYLRKIQDVAPDIRNIFVATDDYRVVSEFRELRPDLSVVSLCEKSKKGYFHTKGVERRGKSLLLTCIISRTQIISSGRIPATSAGWLLCLGWGIAAVWTKNGMRGDRDAWFVRRSASHLRSGKQGIRVPRAQAGLDKPPRVIWSVSPRATLHAPCPRRVPVSSTAGLLWVDLG